MTARRTPSLIERLPAVRGRLTENAPLSGVTWFRVGGPAEVMFRPADRDDLLAFLAAKPADVPVTVLGVASNVLIRDGGLPGVTLRLGRGFADMVPEGSDVVCGAAALDLNVATAAKLAGIAGLEFLSGVPGTIGGAVRMNAGAYGKETRDVLVWAEAADPRGAVHRLSNAELKFAYRRSALPEDWICLGARLAGAAGDPAEIAARMQEIQGQRADSQPIRSRTGGSTFKNPTGKNPSGKNPAGHPERLKAWQLIDAAGCRGLTLGGAMVSDKHCNFLINTGSATAADLENLGEEVRRRVKRHAGVELEWEIKRLGLPAQANGKTGGAA